MTVVIARVLEADTRVREYLVSHGILKQYQKAKSHILEGRLNLVQLKKRKPASERKYQFRITRKYRAHCYRSEADLVVVAIDDHQ